MGAVHFSIDTQLLEHLTRLLPLAVFVETGTFQGDTIQAARPFFEKLYSAEVVEKHHQVASQRFESDAAVTLHFGASSELLRHLSPELRDESVLYWLDAHWCEPGGGTRSTDAQCPLLDELEAIRTLNPASVVLIDDARYFLAPPPEPNDPVQWPTFDEVLQTLRALSSNHEVMVYNDIIICSPRVIGAELRTFAQRHQLDWLAVMNHAADRDQVVREITQALREAEAERSARLIAIQALREGLQASEALSAARLDRIQELQEQRDASAADRAEHLDVIQDLQQRLETNETDRAARLDLINKLQLQLDTSEADRAARLDLINKLQLQLDTSEADRAARLDVIHDLQEQLRTSEADRAARLDTIQALHERLLDVESGRATGIAHALSRKAAAFRAGKK